MASSGAASSNPQKPKMKLSNMGTISDAQIGTRAVRRMMIGCNSRPSTTTMPPYRMMHVQKLLEAAGEKRHQRWPHYRHHRPEVRDELQHRRQDRPERRPRHVQIIEPQPPQRAHGGRVIALGDEPRRSAVLR